jgi:hypothetical protein
LNSFGSKLFVRQYLNFQSHHLEGILIRDSNIVVDFPRKGVRQARKQHDIGDAYGDEEEYPSLEDITVEGVPFVRSLITDLGKWVRRDLELCLTPSFLALDILLYQSAYREHISNIVLAESNRIYNLFRERNLDFRGKVSLIGHSLGSAILFDVLCSQYLHCGFLGLGAILTSFQGRKKF